MGPIADWITKTICKATGMPYNNTINNSTTQTKTNPQANATNGNTKDKQQTTNGNQNIQPVNSNTIDPSISNKFSKQIVQTPNIGVKVYTKTQVYKGSSPVEVVFNGVEQNVESVNVALPTGGIISTGSGGVKVGNSFGSSGVAANGNFLLDLSIPIGLNSKAGTTISINPQPLQNFISSIGEAASQPTLYPLLLPIPVYTLAIP
jgi:hypothetical protein